MIVATIDNRHPVTIALAHAFKTGRVTPEREKEFRNELRDMVIEAAKKFVGFKNVESVRKALDITLGILSLAVAHSTKGKENPEEWAEFVLKNGLKAPVGEVIALVKSIASTSEAAEIDPSEKVSDVSTREHLLKLATSKNRERSRWNGYSEMSRELALRQKNLLEAGLAKWLIEQEVGRSVSGWLQTNKRTIMTEHGEHDIFPSPDEAINNLLFRYCTGLTLGGKYVLTLKDFRTVYTAYTADKKGWKSKALSRYKDIVSRIPTKFHQLLTHNGRDWFTYQLSKGPPAVSKKTKTLDNVSGNVQGYDVGSF